MAKAETVKTTKNGKNIVRILYTPGFDAVFLPGDFNQVAMIAPQLTFYDVKVPLLGTNTWNAPNLTKLADRSIDGGTFVDAFFLDSPDQNIREFVDRYRRKYQTDPSPFAAQAYDATRIIIEAIRRGATTGKAVHDQLMEMQEFPTLTGPAAFRRQWRAQPTALRDPRQERSIGTIKLEEEIAHMNSLPEILHTISYLPFH